MLILCLHSAVHTTPVRLRDYAPEPKPTHVLGHTATFFDQHLKLSDPGTSEWEYAAQIHRYMHEDSRTKLPGAAFKVVADNGGLMLLDHPLIRDILYYDG